jgi:predicted GNAT family acetyltransferase
MDIKEEKTGRKGEFYIENNRERVAKIQFFDSDDGVITVYHTEVDPSLRGKGVGEDLVERVVRYARDHEVAIVATCPYANKLIERNADLCSVLRS